MDIYNKLLLVLPSTSKAKTLVGIKDFKEVILSLKYACLVKIVQKVVQCLAKGRLDVLRLCLTNHFTA